MNRKYGWKPDLPDGRDFKFSMAAPAPVSLPPSANVRNLCSPVEDQGSLGSCTANAWVGLLEFLEFKCQVAFSDLSRLFVYYNERVIEGTINEDSGAYLRDGAKALAQYGVCDEKAWPYIVKKFTKKPCSKQYRDALQRKISVYRRLENITDMKACLAAGFPFVFGFSVYESFESEEVARTGNANLPGPTEQLLGGHAVMAVGYDDATGRFTIRNSWGSGWGEGGYFTLPYAYMESRDLSDDFWTAEK
jgi:C1A family cysteine protease